MGLVFRDIGKRMAGLSAAQTKISSQVGKIEEEHTYPVSNIGTYISVVFLPFFSPDPYKF